jgi:hypothetical protein
VNKVCRLLSVYVSSVTNACPLVETSKINFGTAIDKNIVWIFRPHFWMEETFLILGGISWNSIKEQKSKMFKW